MFYGIVQNFIRHLQQLIHLKGRSEIFCSIRIIKKRYFNKIYCLLSRVVVVDDSCNFSRSASFICASASLIIDEELPREYYRCTIKLRQHCSGCPINCFCSQCQAQSEMPFCFSSGLVEEQSEINICPAGFHVIARLLRSLETAGSEWTHENSLNVYLDFFKNFQEWGIGCRKSGAKSKLSWFIDGLMIICNVDWMFYEIFIVQ
jgi:hypothetical protein